MDNKNPESIHIALGKKAQLNLKQKIQAYLECRICNCCPLEQQTLDSRRSHKVFYLKVIF